MARPQLKGRTVTAVTVNMTAMMCTFMKASNAVEQSIVPSG